MKPNTCWICGSRNVFAYKTSEIAKQRGVTAESGYCQSCWLQLRDFELFLRAKYTPIRDWEAKE